MYVWPTPYSILSTSFVSIVVSIDQTIAVDVRVLVYDEYTQRNVDPCDDFFQYSCGRWIDNNDWELLSSSAYNQFETLSQLEMHQFLDALYYDTNDSLINHTSIQKSIRFYTSCLDSQMSQEQMVKSELFQEFDDHINFTSTLQNASTNSWTNNTKNSFISAISWLSIRYWNFLLIVDVIDVGDTKLPIITQNYPFWLQYNQTMFANTTELFKIYFSMNHSAALDISQKVSQFANNVSNITTASAQYYNVGWPYKDSSIVNLTSMDEINENLVGSQSPNILDINRILHQALDTDDIDKVAYFTPDAIFFGNLSLLLQNTDPQVVQYFLYYTVILNKFNFQDSQQSRSVDRVEFCFNKMLQYFPFVYGYILQHTMYTKPQYSYISTMIHHIIVNGIRKLIENAEWMDNDSKQNSLKKIDNLNVYVGYEFSKLI